MNRGDRNYAFWVISTAIGLLLAAFTSFRFALRSNPTLSEGLDTFGNLSPEAALRVVFVPATPKIPPPLPDLEHERCFWLELARHEPLELQLAGADWLPIDKHTADVVVLPSGSVLSLTHRQKLERFLQAGGGVILTGIPDDSDQKQWYEKLSGGSLIENVPDPEISTSFVPIIWPTSTQLDGIVPPGFGLQVERRVARAAFHPLGYSPPTLLAGVVWAAGVDRALSPPQASQLAENSTTVHLAPPGHLPVAWLAAPPHLWHAASGRNSETVRQQLALRILRYLAGRPDLVFGPWPDSSRLPVSLAFIVDDADTSQILRQLKQHAIPATFLLPLERAAELVAVAKDLAPYGEIGLIATRRYPVAGAASLAAQLDRVVARFNSAQCPIPRGLHLYQNADREDLIKSLAKAPLEYILPDHNIGQQTPVLAGPSDRADFLLFPPPTTTIEWPLDASPENACTIYRMSIKTVNRMTNSPLLADFLQELANTPQLEVLTLLELTHQFYAVQTRTVTSRIVNPHRLHLQIQQGPWDVDFTRLRVYFRLPYLPVGSPQAPLGQPPARISLAGRGVVELELDHLAAGEKRAYFVELME